MRILQINSSQAFGGGERHFVDLCNGLTERGHHVYAAVRPENEWGEKLSFLGDGQILKLPLRNSLDIFSGIRLASLVRRKKIDIVHAHVARDYPPAAFSIKASRGAKLVITRHVMFPLKNIHRLVLKGVSNIIAVSEAVAANLSATFPEEKIVCIHNGLSVDPLRDPGKTSKEFRFEHNISYDSIVVTNVGELCELKGQREFVMAAAEVVKEHPEAFFVIVGKDRSYDQGFRRDLKRLIKVLGIEERVLLLDWIDDLSQLMAATDVFVSSSRSESFGLAILEAMATGNAVVATETAGAKELIEHGETGLLSPIEEPVVLAGRIAGLIEEPGIRSSIAGAAKESAEKLFGLDRMVDDTIALYERALNR